MSKEALISLIGHAALDKTFLRELRDNPVQKVADAGINLTAEELTTLRKVSFTELDKFNNSASTRTAAAVFSKKRDR